MKLSDIDDDTLEYLDGVAAVVAGLLEMESEAERIGELPDENRQALLTLGEAYMYLYNRLLDGEQ